MSMIKKVTNKVSFSCILAAVIIASIAIYLNSNVKLSFIKDLNRPTTDKTAPHPQLPNKPMFLQTQPQKPQITTPQENSNQPQLAQIDIDNPTWNNGIVSDEQVIKEKLDAIDIKKFTPEAMVVGFYNALFRAKYNIDAKVVQDSCVNWKRKDNISFGINGWQITSIRPNIFSIKNDTNVIKTFFIKHGFIENKNNTYINSKEDIMYVPGETLGFEKGNLKCRVSWSESTPDPNPKDLRKNYFNISCAEYTSENENDFQTFLNVLGSGSTKYFCVEKRSNTYAAGRSRSGQWYAKNIEKKWIIVWSGRDIPPCNVIESNKFPREIVTRCYDQQDQSEKEIS